MLKKLLPLAAALLVAAPGAALAGHGKAGLWSVTSTTDMNMQLSPEVTAQMKKMHIQAPTPHAYTSQMCMTQAEVDASQPPHIDRDSTGCTSRITSQTGASMTADMICAGRMKGTGHMQIAYRGAEHYIGSYSFSGSVEGNPARMSTSFRGDWLKADCGAVKPYKLRTQ